MMFEIQVYDKWPFAMRPHQISREHGQAVYTGLGYRAVLTVRAWSKNRSSICKPGDKWQW